MLRFGKLLNLLESTVMVACMATATVLITIQVVLRYVFNDSIIWAEELTRFAIIWMSFIGAGMGVRAGAHISVDLVTSFAPEGLRKLIAGTAVVCGVVFALGLFVYGGRLFLHALSTGQVSSAMQLPMFYVYLIFPISAVLLAIRLAEVGWRLARGDLAPAAPPSEPMLKLE
jgi:C4-dicarboxylate transporter DctQ subunit